MDNWKYLDELQIQFPKSIWDPEPASNFIFLRFELKINISSIWFYVQWNPVIRATLMRAFPIECIFFCSGFPIARIIAALTPDACMFLNSIY